MYLRQVDIPGVHSKLIEAHRGVLVELLDIVLPPEIIDPIASGVSQFAKRYGFREKPVRIRFRVLDPEHALLPGAFVQDITLDAESFALLDPKVSRVFITENEINFLAFPLVKDGLVIFGAGYGFEMLSKAEWLSRCRIHYWGDIDTHGFAILDQLRSQFDHVESFLMDRNTLLAFETLWGEEDKQTLRDLPRVNPRKKHSTMICETTAYARICVLSKKGSALAGWSLRYRRSRRFSPCRLASSRRFDALPPSLSGNNAHYE